MIDVSYDAQADAFYARFAPEATAVAETKEVLPGAMIDVDTSGQMVGIEKPAAANIANVARISVA